MSSVALPPYPSFPPHHSLKQNLSGGGFAAPSPKKFVNGVASLALANGNSNGIDDHHHSGTSRASADTPEVAFAFDSMESALESFQRGEFLVVMDDESRENEGDLIIAADKITTEKMAFMIKHTSGYVCIALPQDRLEELEIPMMLPTNTEKHRTAYTVTVDYKRGTTTGISAHDRALTAKMLATSTSKPDDFTRPGHMVPLRAQAGGTLQRRGHTESAIDMCRLTGLPQAGLLCELVNDDPEGSMARRDDCRAFADKWGFKMISVEMIAQHSAGTLKDA
ncbi:hypothetical protein FRB94_007339 [Tulasnella sp. JGI-2019a]|nr:hypothetical protein FRB94_007339 [Tulasnella sp. JGI-2019a]